MTTALDICTDALALIGVAAEGQDPDAATANLALRFLNRMLAQWARKRWLNYHLLDIACVGQNTPGLTVGPGGAFNTPRPDRIESAYLRLGMTTGLSGQADYPLSVMQSREDYARVMLKSMAAWPAAVFYDAAYPVGTLYVWPVCSQAYEVHILVKDSSALNLPALSAIVTMPPEYEEAMVYNLAGHLTAPFGRELPREIPAMASAALNTLRQANVQVPMLGMPAGVRGGSRLGGGYGGAFAASSTVTVTIQDTNSIVLESGSSIEAESGP